MTLFYSWTAFKTLLTTPKSLQIQYEEFDDYYRIFATEDSIKYFTEIWKNTSKVKGLDVTQNNLDKTDFVDNYKASANAPISPIDDDGKKYIRSESRPLDMTTYFTCAGDKIDDPQEIGNGKKLQWDFSNDDDIYELPSGSDVKMKKITFQFIDAVRIKEGAIYFQNAPKGCHLDMGVWCPEGAYYLDNDGNPVLASEDTLISHWVNKHFIVDSCAVGDELNTESASLEIPSAYIFCVGITTPVIDDTSYGHISLELYRKRTVIL